MLIKTTNVFFPHERENFKKSKDRPAVEYVKCYSGVFQVPSVLFAPSHLMAIMTLGINSALVMDCGYTETLVLPVSFPCHHGVFDP